MDTYADGTLVYRRISTGRSHQQVDLLCMQSTVRIAARRLYPRPRAVAIILLYLTRASNTTVIFLVCERRHRYTDLIVGLRPLTPEWRPQSCRLEMVVHDRGHHHVRRWRRGLFSHARIGSPDEDLVSPQGLVLRSRSRYRGQPGAARRSFERRYAQPRTHCSEKVVASSG